MRGWIDFELLERLERRGARRGGRANEADSRCGARRPVTGTNLVPGGLRDQLGETPTLLVFLRHSAASSVGDGRRPARDCRRRAGFPRCSSSRSPAARSCARSCAATGRGPGRLRTPATLLRGVRRRAHESWPAATGSVGRRTARARQGSRKRRAHRRHLAPAGRVPRPGRRCCGTTSSGMRAIIPSGTGSPPSSRPPIRAT